MLIRLCLGVQNSGFANGLAVCRKQCGNVSKQDRPTVVPSRNDLPVFCSRAAGHYHDLLNDLGRVAISRYVRSLVAHPSSRSIICSVRSPLTRPTPSGVIDITYIRTWQGWLFIAVVADTANSGSPISCFDLGRNVMTRVTPSGSGRRWCSPGSPAVRSSRQILCEGEPPRTAGKQSFDEKIEPYRENLREQTGERNNDNFGDWIRTTIRATLPRSCSECRCQYSFNHYGQTKERQRCRPLVRKPINAGR